MVTKQIKVSDFQDKFITCCECGDEFLFSAGEQAYY
ncbi:MAG: zinc-ribbon domain containing protein, partial [Dehalococcoidales bacterium]